MREYKLKLSVIDPGRPGGPRMKDSDVIQFAIAERIEALVDAVDKQTEVMRPVEITGIEEPRKVTLSKETIEILRNIQRGE
ncbi:hypothetical protein LCGC14_1788980 [marine sediment metagenome]|uniref:Uncharacterized protein n=1 Tax=marine sediment metagenome TaxID=412755 RepID=A0A0F9HFQ3_9ZZZZ